MEKVPNSFKAEDAVAIKNALPYYYPIFSEVSVPDLFTTIYKQQLYVTH